MLGSSCPWHIGREARARGAFVARQVNLVLEARWIMSADSLVPRGNPLTEVMEVTGPDGVPWVAYIDGLPPARPARFFPRTALPGRRLRFDSLAESRANSTLPAGSPFLSERRLLDLLAASSRLPDVEACPPSPALLRRRRWEARIAAAGALFARGRRAVADGTQVALDLLLYGHRTGPQPRA